MIYLWSIFDDFSIRCLMFCFHLRNNFVGVWIIFNKTHFVFFFFKLRYPWIFFGVQILFIAEPKCGRVVYDVWPIVQSPIILCNNGKILCNNCWWNVLYSIIDIRLYSSMLTDRTFNKWRLVIKYADTANYDKWWLAPSVLQLMTKVTILIILISITTI